MHNRDTTLGEVDEINIFFDEFIPYSDKLGFYNWYSIKLTVMKRNMLEKLGSAVVQKPIANQVFDELGNEFIIILGIHKYIKTNQLRAPQIDPPYKVLQNSIGGFLFKWSEDIPAKPLKELDFKDIKTFHKSLINQCKSIDPNKYTKKDEESLIEKIKLMLMIYHYFDIDENALLREIEGIFIQKKIDTRNFFDAIKKLTLYQPKNVSSYYYFSKYKLLDQLNFIYAGLFNQSSIKETISPGSRGICGGINLYEALNYYNNKISIISKAEYIVSSGLQKNPGIENKKASIKIMQNYLQFETDSVMKLNGDAKYRKSLNNPKADLDEISKVRRKDFIEGCSILLKNDNFIYYNLSICYSDSTRYCFHAVVILKDFSAKKYVFFDSNIGYSESYSSAEEFIGKIYDFIIEYYINAKDDIRALEYIKIDPIKLDILKSINFDSMKSFKEYWRPLFIKIEKAEILSLDDIDKLKLYFNLSNIKLGAKFILFKKLVSNNKEQNDYSKLLEMDQFNNIKNDLFIRFILLTIKYNRFPFQFVSDIKFILSNIGTNPQTNIDSLETFNKIIGLLDYVYQDSEDKVLRSNIKGFKEHITNAWKQTAYVCLKPDAVKINKRNSGSKSIML